MFPFPVLPGQRLILSILTAKMSQNPNQRGGAEFGLSCVYIYMSGGVICACNFVCFIVHVLIRVVVQVLVCVDVWLYFYTCVYVLSMICVFVCLCVWITFSHGWTCVCVCAARVRLLASFLPHYTGVGVTL